MNNNASKEEEEELCLADSNEFSKNYDNKTLTNFGYYVSADSKDDMKFVYGNITNTLVK